MTNIKLLRFIIANKIEWRKYDNGEVILWLNFDLLDEWQELLGYEILAEEGLECTMKQNCIVFEMKGICGHFGIDMDEVFEGESWDKN